MSLIINGMEMPKHNAMHGGKDTIYRAVIRVKPDGMATITINFQTGYTYDDGDLKTAPIVEIPTPHGRLIEAPTEISFAELYRYAPDDYSGIAEYFANQIRELPTIIEAEDEKDV